MGYMLGLYRDNGKENGNYYLVLRVEVTPWCLGGNRGMDHGDYYWGLYRD